MTLELTTARTFGVLGGMGAAVSIVFQSPAVCYLTAVLTLAAVTEEAQGVIRPVGSNDADYLALGAQVHDATGSLLFVHATLNGFSYTFNGIRVNKEWAIIPMHAFHFPTGTASIDYLSNGTNFLTSPGDTRVPLLIITNATWNINSPFSSGPDVAFVRFENMPGQDLVFAPVGSVANAEVITFSGSGYTGTSSDNLIPQDGKIRGWRAPVLSSNPGNVSSPQQFTTGYNPFNGIPNKGMGAFLDSGSLAIDSEGRCVGFANATFGGLGGDGGTTVFNFTDAANAALIRTNTMLSPVLPILGYALTVGGMAISWSTNAIGFTLQSSENLSTWTNIGPPILNAGTNTDSGSESNKFFRLMKP